MVRFLRFCSRKIPYALFRIRFNIRRSNKGKDFPLRFKWVFNMLAISALGRIQVRFGHKMTTPKQAAPFHRPASGLRRFHTPAFCFSLRFVLIQNFKIPLVGEEMVVAGTGDLTQDSLLDQVFRGSVERGHGKMKLAVSVAHGGDGVGLEEPVKLQRRTGGAAKGLDFFPVFLK